MKIKIEQAAQGILIATDCADNPHGGPIIARILNRGGRWLCRAESEAANRDYPGRDVTPAIHRRELLANLVRQEVYQPSVPVA